MPGAGEAFQTRRQAMLGSCLAQASTQTLLRCRAWMPGCGPPAGLHTCQLPPRPHLQAFAAAGQMRSAAKFYKQLRRSGPKSLAGAGAGGRMLCVHLRLSSQLLHPLSVGAHMVVHAVCGLRACWQLGHHSRVPAEHRQHASPLPALNHSTGVTMSHRRMWELLIESYCRQGSVKQALQVGWDVCLSLCTSQPLHKCQWVALRLPCCSGWAMRSLGSLTFVLHHSSSFEMDGCSSRAGV